MPRHPVSPKGVLLIVLLDLFKVSKMTNFNYDLFKVSKMCVLFLWLKIAINFQKWVYMGVVDIFLLGILGGCPRLLHYTLLKAWSINV